MAHPIIPYPGGKWYGRTKILPHFPLFIGEMVSPFVGGGSIELDMASRGIRVYASDHYAPLVNLYQHALTDPAALSRGVSRHHPMTKPRFAYLLEQHKRGIGTPLQQAARWYSIMRSSYSGRVIDYTMGNFSGHRFRFTRQMIYDLAHWRAPGFSVDCLDWREALDRHPDLFAYLDPPYPNISRNLYAGQREFNHPKFAEYLHCRQAPFAMSMGDAEYARALYEGLRIVELSWGNRMKGNNKGMLKELLIMNY